MAQIKTLLGSDKLREAYPKINDSLVNINSENASQQQQITDNNQARISDLDNHKSSTDHSADKIMYSGKIPKNNVKAAIDEVDTRIDNIVTNNPTGTKDQEIIDARQSTEKVKTFPTLKARFEEIETEITKEKYSDPVTVTSNIIPIPSNSTKGQVRVGMKGNTYSQIIKNGNFGEGVLNWISRNSSSVVVNNILTNTGDGTSANPYIEQDTLESCVVGKKIFVRAIVRALDNPTELTLRISGSTGGTTERINTIALPLQNNLYLLLGIGTLTDQTGNVRVRIVHTYADSIGANGKRLEIQKATGINITQNSELVNLTADQINQRIPNWFDGTKSTVCSSRLKSVQKNLIKLADGTITHAGVTITVVNNRVTLNGTSNAERFIKLTRQLQGSTSGGTESFMGESAIKLIPTENYKASTQNISGSRVGVSNISLRNIEKITINGANVVIGNDIPHINNISSLGFVFLWFGSGVIFNNYTFDFQLERGTVATPYEPHTSNSMYISTKDSTGKIVELRSVGSAKDEVRFNESIGQHERVQRNGHKNDVHTKSSNTISATQNDVITFRISNYISDAKNNDGANNHATLIVGNNNFTMNNNLLTSNADLQFTIFTGHLFINIAKSKLSTQNIEGFNSWLQSQGNSELTYQLAQQIITHVDVAGSLQSYPNGGTIYIEPIARISRAYGTGITTDLAIKSIESVVKVSGTTKINVDMAKVSFVGQTVTITGATSNEIYEVVYEYPQELSTLPTTTYAYPLNLSATIEGNRKDISRLGNDLADTRAYNNAVLFNHEMRLIMLELK